MDLFHKTAEKSAAPNPADQPAIVEGLPPFPARMEFKRTIGQRGGQGKIKMPRRLKNQVHHRRVPTVLSTQRIDGVRK